MRYVDLADIQSIPIEENRLSIASFTTIRSAISAPTMTNNGLIMNPNNPVNSFYIFKISIIVALGGFLMGFDASVISGVVKFIELEFNLSKIELGWAVASLSLTATLAMLAAGPLSDKFGRKVMLKYAAILFTISAVLSALAPNFTLLVLARMLGGLGVGMALILAPMYIAEIAPAKQRGRLVSLNQLNIVIGISAAFFSNYLVLQLSNSDLELSRMLHIAEWNWRWMLGLEALPAICYLIFLKFVPESPRWLLMQDNREGALAIMKNTSDTPEQDIDAIQHSIKSDANTAKGKFKDLLKPAMRLVMVIGISIAILQQITGINAVFFYAPMIFELSGLGTDAAFLQAIFVGLTNLVFTLLAIALIDKIGRKILLSIGVTGIAVCMFTLALSFHSATYVLTNEKLATHADAFDVKELDVIVHQTFESELEFKHALKTLLGNETALANESSLVSSAIEIDQMLVMVAILGFVAFFAMSLGPVMWVLFSELFPNKIRGIAISFVGLINSGVSFTVQLVFPWELSNLGATMTFAIYGAFALVGLAIVLTLLPETKGKTLEELEDVLVKT